MIKPIKSSHVKKLIDIIRNFGDKKDLAIPLNPFYWQVDYYNGKSILKKTLQILENNGLIEHEITNGHLLAFEILETIDISKIEDAIIYQEGNKVILDANSPKALGSVIGEILGRWIDEGKIKKIDYVWNVGGSDININKNGSKFEMAYISIKSDLKLEKISISDELEYYQNQLQKLNQLERFFEKISSLPLKQRNREAHKILRRYLEEGVSDEFDCDIPK